jgi:hypothetical protein
MVREGASTLDEEWQVESLGRSQGDKGVWLGNLAWMMGVDFQHWGKRRYGWPRAGSTHGRCCVGRILCAS